MTLGNFLNFVSSYVKVNLFVEEQDKGIYANAESLKEESMYQNYFVYEIKVVSKNMLIVKTDIV